MTENEKGWKYSVRYERAASAGKIDGFKVEAQGDNLEEVDTEAQLQYLRSIEVVQANYPAIKETK